MLMNILPLSDGEQNALVKSAAALELLIATSIFRKQRPMRSTTAGSMPAALTITRSGVMRWNSNGVSLDFMESALRRRRANGWRLHRKC